MGVAFQRGDKHSNSWAEASCRPSATTVVLNRMLDPAHPQLVIAFTSISISGAKRDHMQYQWRQIFQFILAAKYSLMEWLAVRGIYPGQSYPDQ